MLKGSKLILHLLTLEHPARGAIQIDHTSTAVNCRRSRKDLVGVVEDRDFNSIFVGGAVFDEIQDMLLDCTRMSLGSLSNCLATSVNSRGFVGIFIDAVFVDAVFADSRFSA